MSFMLNFIFINFIQLYLQHFVYTKVNGTLKSDTQPQDYKDGGQQTLWDYKDGGHHSTEGWQTARSCCLFFSWLFPTGSSTANHSIQHCPLYSDEDIWNSWWEFRPHHPSTNRFLSLLSTCPDHFSLTSSPELWCCHCWSYLNWSLPKRRSSSSSLLPPALPLVFPQCHSL